MCVWGGVEFDNIARHLYVHDGWVRMRTKWLSCFSQENILDFFDSFRLSH